MSDAERAFRALLQRPREYAKWAKEVRAEWMRNRKP